MRFISTAAMRLLPILIILQVSYSQNPANAESPSPSSIAERIYNRIIPLNGVERLKPQELWRAGGEDDEIFFGNIQNVLSDQGGNIYLLDTQLFQILVYTPDGRFRGTLGRQGEGPGEVRNLTDMLFLPDGTLGLGQAFPGKIIKLDLGGNPAGSIDLCSTSIESGNLIVFLAGKSINDLILLAGMRWHPDESGLMQQNMFLSRFDPKGLEQICYHKKVSSVNLAEFAFDEMQFDFIWSRFAILPNDNICFAPYRNLYEIHICNKDAEIIKIISKEYESLKRDDRGKKNALLTGEATGRNYGVPVKSVKVEDTEPDITALQPAQDGSLWVQTSRGDHLSPDGIFTTFDFFDSEGIFLKQVEVEVPGKATEDDIYILPNKRIIVVRGTVAAYQRESSVSNSDKELAGEDGLLEVICYLIP
ncbi:MAG: hypothetical protein KJ970_16325 [Candidatus Eisenbacteria bacterium]|uniref:6-bladed beta-propeller n=1 Tax=Eiseniibacteriota bacterium TaxID=2212470 RepID=A0A948S0A7_UNCEI|nr:hypothetical protein [Candidatus Eisenbacteria bacterium]MBU1951101.1 hypothetical protein [Candidatus Eisenbacteria bacterium]MBU2692487.1 hypothetical protein [Candidatus Eisenbacteria bacterium]